MTKSQLWHFRTTTEGKERSDATSLGVSEVTKRRSFGTSERRREATSVRPTSRSYLARSERSHKA